MKLVRLIIIFFILQPNILLANAFNITIVRKVKMEDRTLGYVFIENKPICYSLEKAWRANQPLISSIPKGTYKATIRVNGKLGWRLELLDVPDRSNVQLHIGNFPQDTTGCLLVGLDLLADKKSLSKSKEAMNSLRSHLEKHMKDQMMSTEVQITIK